MAQIQFTPSQIRDFGVIRDIDPEAFAKAANYLSTTQTPAMKASELVSFIEKSSSVTTSIAESVVRPILWLTGLLNENRIENEVEHEEEMTDELMTVVNESLVENASWNEDEFKKWKLIEPSFRKLLGLDSFRVVATVLNLSYEYANLYRSGRILTDIRPVFSKDAKQISGAVVSFSFCLRFDGVDGDHELNIAMDEGDVQSLAYQCERAITKARTARKLMLDKAGVPTIISGISGDSDND